MTYSIITLETITRTVNGLNGPETITDIQPEPVGTIYREGNVCLVAGSGQATMKQADVALPGIRAWKERYIRQQGARVLDTIASPYEPQERETWPYQREECLAYQRDNTTQTPFCDIIADRRGIPRELFLSKVAENMTMFSQASATILGKQQALIDRVNSVTDLSVLVNLGWE